MSKYKTPHKPAPTPERPAWLLPVVGIVTVVVLIGVVFVLSQSNQSGVAITVSGKPNVAVDKSVIDFGDVQFGKPVTAVFKVSNTGDQPLKLLQPPHLEVLQGCCPPKAIASSSTIDPGGTATVTVTFSMHEGMGGQHEFLVHLLTNDSAQSETQLRIFSNWIA